MLLSRQGSGHSVLFPSLHGVHVCFHFDERNESSSSSPFVCDLFWFVSWFWFALSCIRSKWIVNLNGTDENLGTSLPPSSSFINHRNGHDSWSSPSVPSAKYLKFVKFLFQALVFQAVEFAMFTSLLPLVRAKLPHLGLRKLKVWVDWNAIDYEFEVNSLMVTSLEAHVHMWKGL